MSAPADLATVKNAVTPKGNSKKKPAAKADAKQSAPVSPPAVENSTATAPVAAKPKNARIQVESIIPAPRVRGQIDSKNINESIVRMITEEKDKIKEYTEAKSAFEKKYDSVEETSVVNDKIVKTQKRVPHTPERAAELKRKMDSFDRKILDEANAKIKALSKKKTRFSEEVSHAVAIVCDELLRQLLMFAMEGTIESKRKTVTLDHLLRNGFKRIKYYSLVKGINFLEDEYAKMQLAEYERQKTFELEKALIDAEKAFQHNYGVTKRKVALNAEKDAPLMDEDKTATPAAAPAAPEVVLTVAEKLYVLYIENICSNIIHTHAKYTGLKISDKIKHFLSNLTCEFIDRVANNLYWNAEADHRKTIKSSDVMHVMRILLTDGHDVTWEIRMNVTKKINESDPKVKEQLKTLKKQKNQAEIAKLPTVDVLVAERVPKYSACVYEHLEKVVGDKFKAARESKEANKPQ